MTIKPVTITASMTVQALKVAYSDPDEAVAIEVGWVIKFTRSFDMVMFLLRLEARRADPAAFVSLTKKEFQHLGIELDESQYRQIADGVLGSRNIQLKFDYNFGSSERIVNDVLDLFPR